MPEDADDDVDIEKSISYSKVIITILGYSTAAHNFEIDCMPLIDKIRKNYKNLIHSNNNCVSSYATFLFKAIKFSNMVN